MSDGPAAADPEREVTAREGRRREREARRSGPPQGMVPGRERRRSRVERGAMRIIATGGVIGIAVILAIGVFVFSRLERQVLKEI